MTDELLLVDRSGKTRRVIDRGFWLRDARAYCDIPLPGADGAIVLPVNANLEHCAAVRFHRLGTLPNGVGVFAADPDAQLYSRRWTVPVHQWWSVEHVATYVAHDTAAFFRHRGAASPLTVVYAAARGRWDRQMEIWLVAPPARGVRTWPTIAS